ncbi:MAG TPA: hypothetical protein VF059_11155 [Casimicrobiaceae bacterium]
MRVSAHWFRPGAQRPVAQVAGAAAVVAFRLARNAQRRLRSAGFELPAGAAYFAVLSEILAFLVIAADRIAHGRGDEAWRVEFTTALANRAAEIVADNQSELLGTGSAAACKERFIALVNSRAPDYAQCGFDEAGADYAFLRCAGHRVGDAMAPHERTWAVQQVIEIEAPEAIDALQRAIRDLLDTGPRPTRARGGGAPRG